MAIPLWEIDPTSENAANVPLSLVGDLGGGVLTRLQEMDLTPPDVDPKYAASVDTEGDPYVDSRYRNRTISLTLLMTAGTDSALQTAVQDIQKKIEKLRREGGTLKFTTMAGTTTVGDVNYVTMKPELTKELYGHLHAIRYTLDFDCRPFFRGTPTQLSDHVETTLPCLIFSEATIAGDVPALGKLVIDEDQGKDQWWLTWGLRSRYENSDGATTAALFFEAETRTLLGGSTLAAGGGSGAGSNVIRTAQLTNSYQAVMSTQATGGGAHMTHIGSYRVYVRLNRTLNASSNIWVALEWAQGDFRTFTRNQVTKLDTTRFSSASNAFLLLDLGLIRLAPAVQGSQRWEGRLIAKDDHVGSFGEQMDIDCLFFVPVDEGSAVTQAVSLVPTPTTFTAFDGFDQAAGALTGKTPAIGGVWTVVSGVVDADDFNVNATARAATRVSTSDSPQWRRVQIGTTNLTALQMSVDFKTDTATAANLTNNQSLGLFARYVDNSNLFHVFWSGFGPNIWIAAFNAGVAELNATVPTEIDLNTWYTLRCVIDAAGRVLIWFGLQGQDLGEPVFSGAADLLATGGVLATGKFGIQDSNTTATVITRSYDNFYAATAVTDAAVFASQSVEMRHNAAIREDSAGAIWQDESVYEGDRLYVPASGKESRASRFIVKAIRNDPLNSWDTAIDDISARLTVTPRYLVLPS